MTNCPFSKAKGDRTLYDREALKKLVQEKALQFGDFTLASGKKASYYLDCRCLILDSKATNLIAEGMIDQWQDRRWPDAVGGMAVGAVPIAASILTNVGADPAAKPLRGFFVRKEAKEHGKGKQVEGPVQADDRVMIVEDVVTTGGSSLKAIDICEEFGMKVLGVTAIIDRLEGGREAFADRGIELQSLFTIEDFEIEVTKE